MSHKQSPTGESYWVVDGFLAGEYPGAKDLAEARAKLGQLLAAGVTCFVDLTEEGENDLLPYAHMLSELAAASRTQAEHIRMPIPDISAPSRAQMGEILDLIDARMQQGQAVYVHCWGGVGRTGTVVGCYLARHGIASGDAVLERIAELRRSTGKRSRKSPETVRQAEMVTNWREGE